MLMNRLAISEYLTNFGTSPLLPIGILLLNLSLASNYLPLSHEQVSLV